MSRTAIGVFATGEAERLLDELVSRGFPADGISLLSHDGGEARPGMPIDAMSEPSGPFAGLAGHLLGLHAASITGIGPTIMAGPIAAAVEQAQGDMEDCLFTALCDEGVPEGTARAYTEEVRRGAALVAIRVADRDLAGALDVLRRHHARATEETEGSDVQADQPPAESPFAEAKERFEDAKQRTGERLQGAKASAQDKFATARERVAQKMATGEIAETRGQGESAAMRAEQKEREAGDMRMPESEPQSPEAPPPRAAFEREDVRIVEPGLGERVSETHEESFRRHFADQYGQTGASYEQYSPAYRYGHNLRDKSPDREWQGVESRAQSEWEAHNPDTWERFKSVIRHAWHRAVDRGLGRGRLGKPHS